MQADKPTTPETLRAQAEELRRDFRRYEALQLDSENRLFALRAEPFAPRFQEDEDEERAKLEAFQVGARDSETRAAQLFDFAHKLEAALGLETTGAKLEALDSLARAVDVQAERAELSASPNGARLGLQGAELRKLSRDFRAQLEALRESAKPSELPSRFKRSRIVRAVEVESFGIDHAQYFRGAGAEDFEEVFLGTGSSEREALEDALEALALSGWSFKPEHGFEPEPSAEDYSERDEVSEALEDSKREACGSEPEPRYRVALYPFNGSGPVVLREGLSQVEANGYASDYCAKREREEDGLEVSDLTPETCTDTGVALARFELVREDSGVSDSEGLLSAELEPESRAELERFAQACERFDEEPSELYYYVAVRVSDVPNGDEDGSGLTRYEDSEGREYLFAPDFETAQRAALAEARRSLWAFRLDFLAPSFAPELRTERALSALRKCAESLCEDFAPVVEGLLGANLERVLAQAVREDGLAHFLATYDSAQLEDEDGALRFRVG